MKKILTITTAAGFLALAGAAHQAEAGIKGNYKSSTGRIIKVFSCGGGLGMKIVKAKKKQHVGKTIMCGAKKKGANQWSGSLLNVDDGNRYSGSASLSGTSLVVKGCALAGLLCKTQTWPRVK